MFRGLSPFEYSLDRLARSHFAEPLLQVRILVLVVLILLEHPSHDCLPRNEHDIRIGDLIAHKPRSVTASAAAVFLFLLRQSPIQDARHPIHFFGIALDGAGHLFRVELLEPDRLSVVRALSRPLELEPLLRKIRLRRPRSETQAAFRVVALDQVFDNGTGLPQGDAGVGVVDGGQATVGVDGEVLGLLDFGELNIVELVREAELLQDDADFGRVGTALTPDFDGFDLRRHCPSSICSGSEDGS